MIGANGAGKSTTIRSISGLVRPRSGEVTFEGKALHHLPPHDIVMLGVGQSPEGRHVFLANMTVRENLELGAYTRHRRKAEVKQDMEKVFTQFPRLKEQGGRSLPGHPVGRGAADARHRSVAPMARPRLLLLDEPSLGLAPFLVQNIFKIIREINQQGSDPRAPGRTERQSGCSGSRNRGYVLETGRVVLADTSQNLPPKTTPCGKPISANNDLLRTTYSRASNVPAQRPSPSEVRRASGGGL